MVVADAHRGQGQRELLALGAARSTERLEHFGRDVPADLAPELEFDATFDGADGPSQADREHGFDAFVDDVDRLDDSVEDLLATLTKCRTCVVGQRDLFHVAKGVEHGDDDVGVGVSLAVASVDVTETNATKRRQFTQRGREFGVGVARHSDHVIRPGTASPSE